MKMLLILGTMVFAVGGAVYWFVTGHRPSSELAFWWLVYCASIVYVRLESYFELWREESKETAKNVREIMHRVERLESTVDLARKD